VSNRALIKIGADIRNNNEFIDITSKSGQSITK